MLYMPASTYATPIVLQEAQPVPAARYVMLQSTPAVIPTIPVLSTALVYPKYTLAMKTIEKDETEKTQGIELKFDEKKVFFPLNI